MYKCVGSCQHSRSARMCLQMYLRLCLFNILAKVNTMLELRSTLSRTSLAWHTESDDPSKGVDVTWCTVHKIREGECAFVDDDEGIVGGDAEVIAGS